MGRIGSFNPGSQGPVEPPSSITQYVELMRTECDEDEESIAKHQDKIDQAKKYIQRESADILRREAIIKGIEARIKETAEFIKEGETEIQALETERDSLLVQVQLLQDDEGTEEKVKTLETKIREINNRL